MKITVITPTRNRPNLLQKNIDSATAQTCKDFEHHIIEDEIGIGIAGVHKGFHSYIPNGDYVWRVDDDNEMMSDAIQELVNCIEAVHPDAIICDIIHNGKQLPDVMPPQCAHIDAMNIIVSKDIWMRYRENWGMHYSGDFDFIHAVMMHSGLKLARLPKVIARTNKVSHGRPEE